MKKTGTTKKHAGTRKHASASHKHTSTSNKHTKHSPQHKPAAHHHAAVHHLHHRQKTQSSKKPRQLALGSAVACCSAEALAASLRLAGWPVTDADTYALYRLTALDDDAGATIQDTLAAAGRFGLAGVRLAGYWPVPLGTPGVVLGLELPGPHAVFRDAGRWWSWGLEVSPYLFPNHVADEAWKVRWAL